MSAADREFYEDAVKAEMLQMKSILADETKSFAEKQARMKAMNTRVALALADLEHSAKLDEGDIQRLHGDLERVRARTKRAVESNLQEVQFCKQIKVCRFLAVFELFSQIRSKFLPTFRQLV